LPIYQFEFDDARNAAKLTDQRFEPKNRDGELEQKPLVPPLPPKPAQPRDDIWHERQNLNVAEEVDEILPIGYRTMDRSLKNYFSGIPVPTKDGVRLLEVRVSGGDKPYLIWAQDLVRGRVQLPIMSIRRESEESYPDKFSPAHYHYMEKSFVDRQGTRIKLAYRPVPALISYVLSVWAEHKRDLEYINYQIRSRFNPIADYWAEDEHLRGTIVLKYTSMSVAVDDDVPPDTRANKRYDYNISMEGWLPLPSKIVPAILGRVVTLKEEVVNKTVSTGGVLDTVLGKANLPSVQVRRH
jgi:hypothetical protein